MGLDTQLRLCLGRQGTADQDGSRRTVQGQTVHDQLAGLADDKAAFFGKRHGFPADGHLQGAQAAGEAVAIAGAGQAAAQADRTLGVFDLRLFNYYLAVSGVQRKQGLVHRQAGQAGAG